MRSSLMKTPKKTPKSAAKKPVSAKKKKMADLKSPIRDTISETISFVIKGKLTPIKPIMIDKKLDLITKTNKKPQKCGKVVKMRTCRKQGTTNRIPKKQKDNSKTKTKVQIKAAKKPSAQIIKKSAETVLTDVIPATPKEKSKKDVKNEKKKVVTKKAQNKQKPETVDPIKKPKKVTGKKAKLKEQNSSSEIPNSIDDKNADEIKKQQTIEKLLKQANEEITKGPAKKVTLKERKVRKVKNHVKEIPQKVDKKSPEPEPIKTIDYTSDEISLKELSERHSGETEALSIKKPEIKTKSTPKRKIKTKPKMTLIKKRVMASKNKNNKEEKCKTKVFGFWNGPKRHRVASLNALAKVHCLYENESRGNMLDIIDEGSIKKEYVSRKETWRKDATKVTIKKEPYVKKEAGSDSDDNAISEDQIAVPTRTLRTLPGLRAIGKHWDMHETSSSSDDYSGNESSSENVPVKIKKEKVTQQNQENERSESLKDKKRRRNRNEIMMDLKDMVVRKRMASLNASAILAASYSVEKRASRSHRGGDEDSSSCESGSSEDYFAASDDDTKDEDDVKKEEDRKLIEVHTTPNKKVAVILNQDTDVTITGVYVNSTTRSTHHEGYCSIAGMQYRISATSHTQTAATAVATETLLQGSSSSAPDNSNSDSMPSSKSYTPLDALSNMQPPPGPGIQHNHPVVHGQQHNMGPPQHVLPIPPHQLSPGRRHGCSSAFSSPHSAANYQLPPGHPTMKGEPGYVHGYYQPAGPLISVPHGHGQPPPPPPLTKSVPLSEASPTSTTPSASHDPPPPPSSNGDSSDSEVIITSVTTAKDSVPPPSHPPAAYRYSQYPAAHPAYPYNYPPPYHYPTPPPPPNPSYTHHDLCYPPSPYVHKYPSYRRYLSSAPYYQANPQEIYPVPPSGPSQQSQQVVTATPVTASGAAFPAGANGPPPLLDTYPTPQPALVETYQPPPHYYTPAYGPAPPCYTHSPSRTIPYINPSYQTCPCPMQSCPKNVLTGPLTGDSKRSNISSISKDSMPLPPVALALPLEPASATGPPSPARGSAGMPPPPSPAGATYQPPPPPTKQESQSPEAQDDCKSEKKRKARVGKAMVRNNMQQNQQNTMLLMCNPTNYVSTVKREIESPKEKDIEQKKEVCLVEEEIKVPVQITELTEVCAKTDELEKELVEQHVELKEEKGVEDKKENSVQIIAESPSDEVLQPIVNTVAENVKVKNMKRKLSLSKEKVPEPELVPSPKKKPKLGSYKCLIKKDTTTIKIHNGKRKLITESPPRHRNNQIGRTKIKLKKPTTKRKLSAAEKDTNKRLKLSKPLTVNNHNLKFSSKGKEKPSVDSTKTKSKTSTEVITDLKEPVKKITKKVPPVNSKPSSKSAPAVLDSLFAKNNVDRVIESVISEACPRIPKDTSPPKATEKCGKAKEQQITAKKSSNKNGQVKVKVECRKTGTNRRKSKSKEVVVPQVIARVPRRSLHQPRWSNGWTWEGEPYEAKVFLNSEEAIVVRKCYPAMRHKEGDKIIPRDCVLLKAGPRKNDLPFVAKIASLWENPDDGEMMMSLLWYYRPEHTEQGRLPTDQQEEVFASRHKDSNSVACIDDKCYVLTFNEYCRYCKMRKRIEEGIEETLPCIPNPEPYPRSHRQPPSHLISPEMVFFCRRVYDFRQKRIMKNPT